MALLNSSSPVVLANKEQQLVWLLVRQLGEAQSSPGGGERAERLWQEVAALEIDPDRVINLLYGGHDLNDRQALAAIDSCPAAPRRRWRGAGFRSQPLAGAGRRSAPRAAAQAHPAGR